MKKIIVAVILYLLAFVIIVVGVFCGIRLYKEIKAESYINGSIDISNRFTQQKKEYAKQFTKREIASYRKGQQSAYAHMGNIGKRNSLFIHGNLQRDGAAIPPAAPPADKPKGNRRNTGNKNN